MGRPKTYRPEFVDKAHALAFAGATDREVGEYLGVSERTINNWKHEHPEFGEALTVGKSTADRRVEGSLYRRATGYTFDSEKIMQYEGQVIRAPIVEHVPPDTTAAIFWLKNRMPEIYREKSEVDVNVKPGLAEMIAAARKRVANGRPAPLDNPPLGSIAAALPDSRSGVEDQR